MSLHLRAAAMRPSTFDPDARTIEAIVLTGAPVVRPGYTEVLDLRGVDLSRLVNAPVLDGHQSATTRDQLGRMCTGRTPRSASASTRLMTWSVNPALGESNSVAENARSSSRSSARAVAKARAQRAQPAVCSATPYGTGDSSPRSNQRSSPRQFTRRLPSPQSRPRAARFALATDASSRCSPASPTELRPVPASGLHNRTTSPPRAAADSGTRSYVAAWSPGACRRRPAAAPGYRVTRSSRARARGGSGFTVGEDTPSETRSRGHPVIPHEHATRTPR